MKQKTNNNTSKKKKNFNTDKSKNKSKVGRPKKQIDYELVERMAEMFCTETEISYALDISVRTLQKDDEFLRIYKSGLNKGKVSLRRKQFNLAEKSHQMAIWLGKQYLDQTDKIEQKQEITMSIEDYFKDHEMEM